MYNVRMNGHGLPVIGFAKDRVKRAVPKPAYQLTRNQLIKTGELSPVSVTVIDLVDCHCGLCGNFQATEQIVNPPLGLSNEDLTWELVKTVAVAAANAMSVDTQGRSYDSLLTA